MSANGVDPRSKLWFVITIVILAVAIPKLRSLLGLAVVLTAVVGVVDDVRVRDWIGFLAVFTYLIPLLFVLNLFFYGSGQVLWQVSVGGLPVRITVGGIRTSVLIILRLMIVAGAASWFAMATDSEEFELAMVTLGVPWKLAFTASLTLRLVPEMRRRFTTIEQAQLSRGLVMRGGPVRRAKARLPMLIPFLVSVVQYGYDIGEALEARNFNATQRRTYLLQLEHGTADYLLYLFSLLVVAAFVGFFVAL